MLTRDLSQQELQITSTLEPCPLFQGSFPPFAYTFCRLPLKCPLSPWLGTPECRVLKTTPVSVGVLRSHVCGKSVNLTAGGRRTQVVW